MVEGESVGAATGATDAVGTRVVGDHVAPEEEDGVAVVGATDGVAVVGATEGVAVRRH
jgi:hypothetical protein